MDRKLEELKELLTEALGMAKKRPGGVYYDYTLYFPVLRSKLPNEDSLYYWNVGKDALKIRVFVHPLL